MTLSYLLALPLELRDLIYDYALLQDTNYATGMMDGNTYAQLLHCVAIKPDLERTRFARRAMMFTDSSNILQLVGCASADTIQLITTVYLDLSDLPVAKIRAAHFLPLELLPCLESITIGLNIPENVAGYAGIVTREIANALLPASGDFALPGLQRLRTHSMEVVAEGEELLDIGRANARESDQSRTRLQALLSRAILYKHINVWLERRLQERKASIRLHSRPAGIDRP